MGAVFLIALILYFYRSWHSMERQNTVYSTMEEPSLPVAYVSSGDYLMNPMHAYLQDMGKQAARDMITVLPQDRQLKLVVQEYDNMVASASYEIRTLDLSHLIEKGTVSDISRSDGNASLVLPIQNLINKDQAYLLHITLETGAHTLNYYTRILWTDRDYTKAMEDVAFRFTTGSFDSTNSKDITTYLETKDTADNSSLGHVDLHSSFNQITWGKTGMQPKGNFYMTLKEFDGMMGEIQISYESYMTDENGEEKHFLNEDNFVFRNDPERVYMMDFDRTTHQIFEGDSEDFAGKRITLGVGNTDDIAVQKSKNEHYIAFKTDQGLWRYDQSSKSGHAVNIFSYRSDTDDGVRASYDQHDIKILSVSDKGDVYFLVYGYVNRGSHEGYNGILYYRYDSSNDTVTENFFIAIPEVYDQIRWNLEKLAYLSGDGLLYLYYGGSIYGIDTNSLEVVTIATGLQESGFASSDTQQYIAYQNTDAEDIYHAAKITLVNLESNQSSEIQGGGYLRVIGFNQDDLIYGIINPAYASIYTEKHKIPISEIHIVGPDLSDKTSYAKDGLLFTNVRVSGTRLHFDKIRPVEGGHYEVVGEDTIISNREQTDARLSGVGSYTDKILQKVWYIEIKDLGTKHVRSTAPKNLSLERASSIDLNITEDRNAIPMFYAYAHGHFQGRTRTLEEAYELVYDDFGYVLTADGEFVWNRVDKSTMVTIQNATALVEEPLTKLSKLTTIDTYDTYSMVNAYGMDLGSALYFLNKGYPLIAYLEDSCYLIYSYDSFNIRLVDPVSGSQNVVGREDAEAMFRQDGNRFVGIVPHKT